MYTSLRTGIAAIVSSVDPIRRLSIKNPSEEFDLVVSAMMPGIFEATSQQQLQERIRATFAEIFGAEVAGPTSIYAEGARSLWEIRVKCGVESSTVAAEFQRRRRATWIDVRWWLISGSIEFIGICVYAKWPNSWQGQNWPLPLLLTLMLATSLAVVRILVRRNLRCPCCNRIPLEWDLRGSFYDWNPGQCPHCHALLRN